MKTAVQLRYHGEIVSYTVYGKSWKEVYGSLGKIVLYEDGQIVVFIVSKINKKKAFVFKTGPDGTYKVPGVFPDVLLLAQTRTKYKTDLLIKFIHYIEKQEIDLNTLPDGFFIRFNTLMEQRCGVKECYHLLSRYL